jgi:hypothetical protein
MVISFESAEEVCCTFVKFSLASILARDVLSDYRYLLIVASRLSFSFAATQYSAVANRVREQSEDHSGSNGRDEAAAGHEACLLQDIEKMAHILQFCVRPRAADRGITLWSGRKDRALSTAK